MRKLFLITWSVKSPDFAPKSGDFGLRQVKILLLSIFLVCVITACNIPSAPSGISENDQAATIVAMTLQAAQSTPIEQPLLNTPTAISIITKSGGPAMLTVTENSNCRSGPGINYKQVTVIPKNTTVAIIAGYASGNFWIVNPADGTDNCWVDGTLGTVKGDTTTLPKVTPVASTTKGTPERPGSLYFNYSCPFGNLTTTLTWSDHADNETGYRVYRDNQLIIDLPANSSTYTDTTTITVGTSISFSVEAYNEAGASAQRTISFSCE